ncbi:hypothetical protein B9Z19DRAFT_1119869 [Tuber borchii]|uniref:Uncharacterized protein n=1 Tax=Tuber borchii TaxID=42251 RepID=A0A2T7A5S7_TUBBO|nr:hypothetical protein B9Z19DRAFT_1119869 [Tuber borchii]
MASRLDVSPPPGGQGLIAVRRTVYAAPGGSYASMEFLHAEGCLNTAPHHDAVVRDLVARMNLYDFSLVEASANAVLLTRGCLPDCHFDRASTMGLYVHGQAEGSPYAPSVTTPNPSQITSSGSVLDPVVSDPAILSSSWPSLAAPTPPSPSPSPIRVVPAALAQASQSSSYYGSTPSSSMLHALSSGEWRLYGPNFRLDAPSDETYRPTDVSSPSSPVARIGFGGSGFAQSSPPLPAAPPRIPAPIPVSRRGVRFVGANESHPPTPSPVVSSIEANPAAVTPLVPCSQDNDDVSMSLGDGKNTNTTGLGDSMHAVPESSLPSSFARLPASASSVTRDMLCALDDIREGRSSPMSEETDSLDEPMDDVPTKRFHFEGATTYGGFEAVAGDVRILGTGHNELLDAVVAMSKRVIALENLTQRLQRRIDSLEDVGDDIKFGKQCATPGPANGAASKVKLQSDAAEAIPVLRPPPPPPVPVSTRPVTSGPAACAPNSWSEVVRRGTKHKVDKDVRAIGTGDVPRMQRQQQQQQPRPVRTPASVSPAPIAARERHITLRFAARKSMVLPPGCSAESIRTRMNSVFANNAKIRDSHPYVKEARLRADIGAIFMTLAEHSAEEVGGLLEKVHAILMRDLNLPDFAFARDTRKVDVLVVGVPLADTGHGSIWRLEDWTNDRVYDGLRTDLERSNPGLITAGRPNIIGSLHAMRASGATNCAIKFTVEKSAASDAALRTSKVCLRGGNRSVRLWTRDAPAKVCNNCLTLGHISTLCAIPPRCRWCRGNHSSRSHLCAAQNCDGVAGEACQHTVRLCLLCESSGHYTGYPQCPSLKLTPDATPPPLGGSPIAEAGDSVSGVTDRSRNREHRRRQNRRRPTPVGERQINESTMAKDVAAQQSGVGDKGKGRAWDISDEEEEAYGDGSWGPAGCEGVDADCAPKSIIKRPASAPTDGHKSGLTG